jgi:hypothetical protein
MRAISFWQGTGASCAGLTALPEAAKTVKKTIFFM